jgi:hypothetical protein
VLCQLVVSPSAFYPLLVHRLAGFPQPSSPQKIALLQLASGSGLSMVLIMSGLPTGDFHPIYNAPMMGAHKAMETTPVNVTIPAAQEVAPSTSVSHLER